MPKSLNQFYDPFFVDTFPYYPLSMAQQSTYERGKDASSLFLMWSRQVGKSNLSSYMAWDKMINYEYTTQKTKYLILHPQDNAIQSIMLDDILLEPFGGAGVVPDLLNDVNLNCVYIKPPEWWLDRQINIFENDRLAQEEILNAEIENKNKKIKLDIGPLQRQWQVNRWILKNDKQIYVKLFIENLSRTRSQAHFNGRLFNGAQIVCLAANQYLHKAIRGSKLQGVYGEEMGEYGASPFDIITPALLSKDDSWSIFAGTPNGSKPMNWLYDKFKLVKYDPNCQVFFEKGVDYYISEVITELPPSAEDLMKETSNAIENIQIKTKTVWSIGEIEKIFPYVYDGSNRYAKIQAQRTDPQKAEVKRTDMLEVVRDDSGNPIYIISDLPKNPSGIIDNEKYEREYRVKFVSIDSLAFPEFNPDVHIIDHNSYNWDKHPLRILGYDHGVGTSKITKTVNGHVRSASTWSKIACFPIRGTNSYQYVIYDVGYLFEPTEQHIADLMYSALLEGMPVVAENVLWRNTIMGGQTDIMRIISSSERMKDDRRAWTNTGIFKCYKYPSFQNKYNAYNNYFKYTSFNLEDGDSTIELKNPLNPLESGYKVVMTDRCLELAQFFSSHMFVTDKDGNKKPDALRDDIFDGATYPIDTLENPQYKATKTNIIDYWSKHKSMKNNDVDLYRTRKAKIIV